MQKGHKIKFFKVNSWPLLSYPIKFYLLIYAVQYAQDGLLHINLLATGNAIYRSISDAA